MSKRNSSSVQGKFPIFASLVIDFSRLTLCSKWPPSELKSAFSRWIARAFTIAPRDDPLEKNEPKWGVELSHFYTSINPTMYISVTGVKFLVKYIFMKRYDMQ